MDSNELVSDETSDQISPSNNDSTKNIESCRTISQDLRFLDDALNHAIDQMKIFNSETMSDLSLKYELMRNNEVRFSSTKSFFFSIFFSVEQSRVIGFFAHQLILIDEEKNIRQNRNFHSEFVKLDRFLSVLNFNPKSVEVRISRPMTKFKSNNFVSLRFSVHRQTNSIRRFAQRNRRKSRTTSSRRGYQRNRTNRFLQRSQRPQRLHSFVFRDQTERKKHFHVSFSPNSKIIFQAAPPTITEGFFGTLKHRLRHHRTT